MLAHVIKNSVLIILIILILHFLIRNLLAGKPKSTGSTSASANASANASASASASASVDTIFDSNNTNANANVQQEEKRQEELPPPKFSHPEQVSQLNSSFIPKKCTDTDELYQYVFETKPFKPKTEINDAQVTTVADNRGTSSHMIIKEYNNEKMLNGGELFSGLEAFDGQYDMSYDVLKN